MPSFAPRKSVYNGCCATDLSTTAAARAFCACAVTAKIKLVIVTTTRPVVYRFIFVPPALHGTRPAGAERATGIPPRTLEKRTVFLQFVASFGAAECALSLRF